MQINFDTIKTVGYVLKNRLKGYKLLRNQKNTDPNSVTMIKSFYGTSWYYHDEVFINTRIHRHKVDGKFIEDKKEILAKYLMDPAQKRPSGQKNLSIYIKKGEQSIYKEKEVMSEWELNERPRPKWNNEHEEWIYEESLHEKNKPFYFPHVSWFNKLISLGLWKRLTEYDGRPMEKSFLDTLMSNLNNSPKI